jgi:hypothetical protein
MHETDIRILRILLLFKSDVGPDLFKYHIQIYPFEAQFVFGCAAFFSGPATSMA